MRLGYGLSLLLHAAAVAVAWWLLGNVTPPPQTGATLHIREVRLADPEPPMADPPPPPHPGHALEPIDPPEPPEFPFPDVDEPDRSEPTLELFWALPDASFLTRPVRLRRPAPPKAAPPPPEPVHATVAPARTPAKQRGKLTAPRPRKDKSPAARYPARAQRFGLEGEVVVRVRVGADGKPTKAEIYSSSGHKSLDRAAQATVLGWAFHPAQRDGRPVAQWIRIPFRFELRTTR